MSERTRRLLSHLADALIQGDFEPVTQHAVYPLPCFHMGELTVFGSACTLAEGLSVYRDAMQDAGVTKLTPRLVATGVPVRGYSNVWIEWDHLDKTGACLRSSQVRYAVFQAADERASRIEMIDYTVAAFPDIFLSISEKRRA